jgi:hypothetical protein
MQIGGGEGWSYQWKHYIVLVACWPEHWQMLAVMVVRQSGWRRQDFQVPGEKRAGERAEGISKDAGMEVNVQNVQVMLPGLYNITS